MGSFKPKLIVTTMLILMVSFSMVMSVIMVTSLMKVSNHVLNAHKNVSNVLD